MLEARQERFANLSLEGAPFAARFLAWRHRRRLVFIALVLTGAGGAQLVFEPAISVWFVVIAVLACVITPIRTYGTSMLPTLATWTFGVVLLAPPFRYRRGDLVMVVADGLRPLAKRLVALEGDHVRSQGGRIFVNDRLMTLSADLTQSDPRGVALTVVPPGMVYVLGEHLASIDSRQLGTFPLHTIAGRYVPILNRPVLDRISVDALPPADRRDIADLRERGATILACLDEALAVGSMLSGHRWLLLRWAWMEVGDHERLRALLRRAYEGSVEPQDRAHMAVHLAAAELTAGHYAAALALLEGERRDAWPSEQLAMDQLRSSALARLGRYEDALASSEALGPLALPGVVVSALLGLGQVEDARVCARAIESPRWLRAFVDAYLAEADGDLELAARSVEVALEEGFPDHRLLASTPHLAKVRESRFWHADWGIGDPEDPGTRTP